MILKTVFDYLAAFFLVLILSIPMLFLWLFSTLSTGQNGLYTQKRIGKNGLPFTIYKFRSIKGNPINSVTTENTHEITSFGKFMIKTKLDELPQLFNILNGTMSFVGPRPDVPGYADQLLGDDRKMLQVKPGITGPAQLAYKNEYEMLNAQSHPVKYNDEVLWPDKVKINKKYVEEWSFAKDMKYLWKTIF